MRNFEERMAEIQKRSQARITRRRNKITALCVPLVAALCVTGAMLIPRQATMQSAESVPTATAVQLDHGSVIVIKGNQSDTYTSPDTVDALRHLVSSLPPVQNDAEISAQRYNQDINTQVTSLTESFTIILEAENETMRYKLVDKLLVNLETDEMYALTDAQRAELLKLLSII